MDDLISRQAAIDALGDKPLAWTEGEYELGLQNQWQSDVDALKAAPSAQPMRKKGKWRWSEDMMCFICSECESGWKEQPTLMGKPLYDWCPVCGAKMEGCDETD